MQKPLEQTMPAKPDTESPAESTATATATPVVSAAPAAGSAAGSAAGVSATATAAGTAAVASATTASAAAAAATADLVPALQTVNIFTPGGNYHLISTTAMDKASIVQLVGPLLLFSQQRREHFLAHEMAGMANATAAQLVEAGNHYLTAHGNPNQAIKYYTAAIEKAGNLLEAYQQRANAYLASKKLTNAIADADFVLAQNSNNFEMITLKTFCLFKLDRFAETIPAFESMITLRPDCVDGYSGLMGAILEECKKTRKFDAEKLKMCAEKTIELGEGLDIAFGKAVLNNLQKLISNPSAATVEATSNEMMTGFNEMMAEPHAESAAAEPSTDKPKPK